MEEPIRDVLSLVGRALEKVGEAMSKQITLYGLIVKQPTGRGGQNRKYTNIERVYDVEDDVELEDIEYSLRKNHARIAPVREDGSKNEDEGIEMVGVEYGKKASGKILNRIGFQKQFEKDLKSLHWKEETEKPHRKGGL